MKKQSQTQIALTAAQRENTILMLALQNAIEGEITWHHKKGSQKFGTSRLTSPSGGLFFERFAPQGQRPSITVCYLEDAQRIPCSFTSPEALERARAIELALVMRQRAYDQEEKGA